MVDTYRNIDLRMLVKNWGIEIMIENPKTTESFAQKLLVVRRNRYKKLTLSDVHLIEHKVWANQNYPVETLPCPGKRKKFTYSELHGWAPRDIGWGPQSPQSLRFRINPLPRRMNLDLPVHLLSKIAIFTPTAPTRGPTLRFLSLSFLAEEGTEPSPRYSGRNVVLWRRCPVHAQLDFCFFFVISSVRMLARTVALFRVL